MCGRIIQTRSPREYAAALGWADGPPIELPGEPLLDYDGTPGRDHWIFRMQDGAPFAEPVTWQYLSPFARLKNRAPAINARAEKLLTRYYITMTRTGRVIVPADGWYEWTGPKGERTRWVIRPKNLQPVYFAALTNRLPGAQAPEKSGFVIVTDAAAGGMVDVHDRRPIALSPEDAQSWMNLDVPAENAAEIARTRAMGSEDFDWYQVASRPDPGPLGGAKLLEPIEDNAA